MGKARCRACGDRPRKKRKARNSDRAATLSVLVLAYLDDLRDLLELWLTR